MQGAGGSGGSGAVGTPGGAAGVVIGGVSTGAGGGQFLSPAGGGSGSIAVGAAGGGGGAQPQQSGGGIGTPASGGNAAGGAKRRGRPVPGSVTGGVSSYKIGEAAPAPRRKKRKAPEKQIPDRVAALLPESALYSQLLEFEARVDAALARKKMDIQDAVRTPARLLRTLRIYVFNTYANQANSASAVEMQNQYMCEPPSWTLRVMGRILEDSNDPENGVPSAAQQFQASKNPKFSSFFKRVTFQLDRGLHPDNHTILWDVSRASSHVEGFEIKRTGDQEFKVFIRLEMNYSPERFKLSASLAEMLGIEVETRPRIIAALWQYIKAKKLQNPSDPTIVNCDPPLQKILGEEKIKFAYISNKLQQHLSPPPPIVLEHAIKLSGRMPVGNACYDVQVDIPAPLQKEMNAFLNNIEKHRDIDTYDDMICAAISKINEHRRRRAFFLGFSHSPVDFINGLIASQSRDLKIVGGQASRNAEKERRSDFYNQPWVEDAVIRYLNRKPAKTAEVPGTM